MAGETEVQLCARLRAWGESLGFDVYPEVDGWDLVFVSCEKRKLGGQHSSQIIAAGKQVGIHAKLRASFEVLQQACWEYGSHPAYPFVAVPVAGGGFNAIAKKLGIGVIEADRAGYDGERKIRVRGWLNEPGPESRPQLRLPPVASRCIEAGAPSPRVLSHWRVKALRFLEHARSKGIVTASELNTFGLNKSFADRWLVAEDWTTETNKRGKMVRVRTYRLHPDPAALPDFGYEDVAAELLAAAPDARGAA